ncbi:unnamed protein product [Urochloa humidicola]
MWIDAKTVVTCSEFYFSARVERLAPSSRAGMSVWSDSELVGVIGSGVRQPSHVANYSSIWVGRRRNKMEWREGDRCSN